MARVKEITLFSKNSIVITKYTNTNIYNQFNTLSYRQIDAGYKVQEPITKTVKKTKSVKTRKKSQFGFYYDSVEIIDNVEEQAKSVVTKDYTKTSHQYTVLFPKTNTTFVISYYTKVNDAKISHEMRPWDFDGVFEDHYINDLKNVLDGIFADFDFTCGVGELYACKSSVSAYSLMQSIYLELFDSVEGFKQMTNEQKILAHGFDLKTSFRKM